MRYLQHGQTEYHLPNLLIKFNLIVDITKVNSGFYTWHQTNDTTKQIIKTQSIKTIEKLVRPSSIINGPIYKHRELYIKIHNSWKRGVENVSYFYKDQTPILSNKHHFSWVASTWNMTRHKGNMSIPGFSFYFVDN